MRAARPEHYAAPYTSLQWATVFGEHAHRLLECVLALNGIECTFEFGVAVVSREALDPHVNRRRLMDP